MNVCCEPNTQEPISLNVHWKLFIQISSQLRENQKYQKFVGLYSRLVNNLGDKWCGLQSVFGEFKYFFGGVTRHNPWKCMRPNTIKNQKAGLPLFSPGSGCPSHSHVGDNRDCSETPRSKLYLNKGLPSTYKLAAFFPSIFKHNIQIISNQA